MPGIWVSSAPSSSDATDGIDVAVTNTAEFTVTATSEWGVTPDGRAYHDTAGAAASEAATFYAATRPYLES